MNALLRSDLERHQAGLTDRNFCRVCGKLWPCDASRALVALDAAEQERDSTGVVNWRVLAERAEAQVTALREALNAHRECNRTSSFDLRVLADTAAASERHDAQVIAAERARLRERLSHWTTYVADDSMPLVSGEAMLVRDDLLAALFDTPDPDPHSLDGECFNCDQHPEGKHQPLQSALLSDSKEAKPFSVDGACPICTETPGFPHAHIGDDHYAS